MVGKVVDVLSEAVGQQICYHCLDCLWELEQVQRQAYLHRIGCRSIEHHLHVQNAYPVTDGDVNRHQHAAL